MIPPPPNANDIYALPDLLSTPSPLPTIIPPPAPIIPPRRNIATLRSLTDKRNENTSCSWCLSGKDPLMGLCTKCYPKVFALLNSTQWRRLRDATRQQFPFCAHCKIKDTEEIHHIKGWFYFPSLFFSPENLMPLCASCHTLYYTHKEQTDVLLKYAPMSGTP